LPYHRRRKYQVIKKHPDIKKNQSKKKVELIEFIHCSIKDDQLQYQPGEEKDRCHLPVTKNKATYKKGIKSKMSERINT